MADVTKTTGKSKQKKEKKEREKKSNYSPAEENLIQTEVEKNADVLLSNNNSADSMKRKAKIWGEIAEKCTSLGVEERTLEEVRNKWRNIKREAKHAYTEHRMEVQKTGGGPQPNAPKPCVGRVIGMLQTTAGFKGIDGGLESTISDGKEGNPLILKAQEMHSEIKKFLHSYKPSKSLPMIGDSIWNTYDDGTKGLSEGDREALAQFLSMKYKEIINVSVIDLPSMLHNTIAFIHQYPDMKGTLHIDQSSDEEDVYEDANHELFTEDQTPAVVNLADNPVLTQANLQLPRAPVCAKKSVATVPRSSSSTNGNGRPTAATTVNGNKRSNSENPDPTTPAKRTIQDIHNMQYRVLEAKLKKANSDNQRSRNESVKLRLQIKLLRKMVQKPKQELTLSQTFASMFD